MRHVPDHCIPSNACWGSCLESVMLEGVLTVTSDIFVVRNRSSERYGVFNFAIAFVVGYVYHV